MRVGAEVVAVAHAALVQQVEGDHVEGDEADE